MPRKAASLRTAAEGGVVDKRGRRIVNLALQGGGAHGAFAWGILDGLLEDDRLDFEAITATSAGSMNAVIVAQGLREGGPPRARELLDGFWGRIADIGSMYSPIRPFMWELPFGREWEVDGTFSYRIFEAMTRMFSPYQLNPRNFHPLRDLLEETVNFDLLRDDKGPKVFLSATNVNTGRVRVFRNEELTLDVVAASACLPFLFHAVEIDGQHYWDGGYLGNPALFPLNRHTVTPDLIIVHLNPLTRERLPRTPHEIFDRINEVSFNSSLLAELRHIAHIQRMLDLGWIKEEAHVKRMYIHAIRADDALSEYSIGSKLSPDRRFLLRLREQGRACAEAWLAENFDALGERSSVDLHTTFLDPHQRGWWDDLLDDRA
ncbi:patatin-like phospholipase family protein [Uliginosibacterium sp. H1]|uniref:patatin-like phospholipase family protein n=1 Tax=Uliginosibacterium sp. H1 TaxID=3114757 RepID=UPI002E18E680|nr:patatin-like phospholipase family protein [Uliginosibacterium sp. H1]